MRTFQLLKGIATYLPGANRLLSFPANRAVDEASYCYGVWLKHLTLLRESGMSSIPDVVVELGPGNSLGVGLCALLSGASLYHGLDVVPLALRSDNVAVLDRLVDLFRNRAPRPTKGWPDFDEYLGSGLFPRHILTDEILERSLEPKRIGDLRASLQHGSVTGPLHYAAPWGTESVERGSADLILSHVVLQSVMDLPALFTKMNVWLRTGGHMSHQMDLSSHEIADGWNGHYTIPRWQYRLACGRRPFFVNRVTASEYMKLAEASGFVVTGCRHRMRESAIQRSQLVSPFKQMSEEDLRTVGLVIQAVKERNA